MENGPLHLLHFETEYPLNLDYKNLADGSNKPQEKIRIQTLMA